MTEQEEMIEMARERYLATFDQDDYRMFRYLCDISGKRINDELIDKLQEALSIMKDVRCGQDWDAFDELWKTEECIAQVLEELGEDIEL